MKKIILLLFLLPSLAFAVEPSFPQIGSFYEVVEKDCKRALSEFKCMSVSKIQVHLKNKEDGTSYLELITYDSNGSVLDNIPMLEQFVSSDSVYLKQWIQQNSNSISYRSIWNYSNNRRYEEKHYSVLRLAPNILHFFWSEVFSGLEASQAFVDIRYYRLK